LLKLIYTKTNLVRLSFLAPNTASINTRRTVESETHYSLKEVILMHINEVKEDAMFIECLSTVGVVMFVVFFA